MCSDRRHHQTAAAVGSRHRVNTTGSTSQSSIFSCRSVRGRGMDRLVDHVPYKSHPGDRSRCAARVGSRSNSNIGERLLPLLKSGVVAGSTSTSGTEADGAPSTRFHSFQGHPRVAVAPKGHVFFFGVVLPVRKNRAFGDPLSGELETRSTKALNILLDFVLRRLRAAVKAEHRRPCFQLAGDEGHRSPSRNRSSRGSSPI